MNVLLWVLQVLLAVAFLAHGLLLLFPPAAMVDQMNASLSREFQLFIGVAEILAAVGLTLPGVTRIQPWLVPCASGGLMVVMISATIFHIARADEFSCHHDGAAGAGYVRRLHALAGGADTTANSRVGITDDLTFAAQGSRWEPSSGN
jgi:uncharacterized membrane protein YphA (DoxX/SURF4 family)